MTKEKIDDFDIDAELFGDDGMPNWGDVTQDKKRSVVTDIKSELLNGVKSAASDRNNWISFAKRALPRDYEYGIDTAVDTYRDVNEEMRKTVNKLRPVASRLGALADRAIPEKFRRLKSGAKALQDWGTESKYNYDSAKAREDAITAELTRVFGAQLEQQVRSEQEAKSRAQIQGLIEFERHKETSGHLGQMALDINRLTNYQISITQAYQKKSLELQFRSFNIQKDLYELQKKTSHDTVTALTAIVKNTGLPDFVKVKKTELLKQNLTNRFFNKGIDKFSSIASIDNIRKAFLKNLGTGTGDFIDLLGSGVDMGEMAFDMKQMMDDMGMDESQLPGWAKIILPMISGTFVGEGMKWAGGKLRRKLGSDSRIRAGGRYIRRFKASPDLAIQDIARRLSPDLGDDFNDKRYQKAIEEYRKKRAALVIKHGEDSPEVEELDNKNPENNQHMFYGAPLYKKAVAHFFSQLSSAAKQARDPTFSGFSKKKDLFEATPFSVQAHESITKVIPGYLARILRESEYTTSLLKSEPGKRSKVERNDLQLFDWENNGFIAKKDLQARAEADIKSSKRYNTSYGAIGKFIQKAGITDSNLRDVVMEALYDAKGNPDIFSRTLKSRVGIFSKSKDNKSRFKLIGLASAVANPNSELHILFLDASNELIDQGQHGANHLQDLDRYQTRDVLSTLGISSDGRYDNRDDKSHWMQAVRSQNTLFDPKRVEDIRKAEEEEILEQETDNGFSRYGSPLLNWLAEKFRSDISRKDVLAKLGSYKGKVSSKLGNMTRRFTELGRSLWTYKDSKQNQLEGLDPNVLHEGVMAQDTYRLGMSASDRELDGLTAINALLKSQQEIAGTLNEILKRMDGTGIPGAVAPYFPGAGYAGGGGNGFMNLLRDTASMAGRGAMGIGRAWMGMLGGGFNLAKNTLGTYLPKGFALASSAVRGGFGVLSGIKDRLVGDITDVSGKVLASLDDLRDGKIIAIGPNKKEMLIRTVDDMEKAAREGYTQLQRVVGDGIDAAREKVINLNEDIRGKYFLKAPWMRAPMDLFDKVFKFYKRAGGAVIGALPRGWQMVANATKFGFRTLTGLIDKPLDIYSKKSFKEAPKGTAPEPKIRKEDFEAGILQDIKGKTINRPSDISGPVFKIDGEGRTMVLTVDDISSGLVDGQGNPITLSISGKLKDMGKGILGKGLAIGRGYINLLKKGISGAGRAVSGIWKGIRSALGGLGIDTQLGIIGGDEFLERLTEIRDILNERLGGGKKSFTDKDGDGDRDNSWQDQRENGDKTPWWERIKRGFAGMGGKGGKDKDKDKKDDDDSWWSKLGLGAFGAWFLAKVKGIISKIFGFIGGLFGLLKKIPGVGKLLSLLGLGTEAAAGAAGAAGKTGTLAKILSKFGGKGKMLAALLGLGGLAAAKNSLAGTPEEQAQMAEGQLEGQQGQQGKQHEQGSSLLGTAAKTGATLGGMWGVGKLLGNKGGIVGATARGVGAVGGLGLKTIGSVGKVGLGAGKAALGVGKFALGKVVTPLAVLDGLNDLRKGDYGGAALSLGSAALFSGAGMAALKAGAAAVAGAVSLPVALGIGAVAVVGGGGYLAYKYLTGWKQTEMSQLRMLQYGLDERYADICKKVYAAEKYLQKHVEVTGETCTLKKSMDIGEVVKILELDGKDENVMVRFGEWFANRFKPVFFTHLSAIFNLKKKKDIAAIDKDLKTPEEKLEFIKKVAMPGGPWNIRALPFGKDMVTNITGEMIKAAINGFIDKLSKEKPAKKYDWQDSLESMDATGYIHKKGKTETKKELEYRATGVETLQESNSRVAKKALQDMRNSLATEGKMKGISVQSKSITDWIFKAPVNAIQAIKYKAYGLIKLDQGHVSAIRWLELACYEHLRKLDENNVEFTGNPVEMVADAAQYFGFGTEDEKKNENWIKWFIERFLPVYTTYTALIMQLKQGSVNFRQNEATFDYRSEEALALADKIIGMKEVWNFKVSPWPDVKLGTDANICQENIDFIKENIKRKTLAEEAKKANAAPSSDGPDRESKVEQNKNLQEAANQAQANNSSNNGSIPGSTSGYSSNAGGGSSSGGSYSYSSDTGGEVPAGVTDVAARALQAARARANEPGSKYILGSGHSGKDPRHGNKAYDCSSFVGWAYTDAGINVPRHMPNTAGMRSAYTNLGFTWHGKNINSSNYKKELLPGDILLRELAVTNKTGHTEMYAGNGNLIGAHSSRSGVSERSKIYGNYNGFLRWEKSKVGAAPTSTSSSGDTSAPSGSAGGYAGSAQQTAQQNVNAGMVSQPPSGAGGSLPTTPAPSTTVGNTEEYRYERPKDEKKAAAYDQLKKLVDNKDIPEANKAAARREMEKLADKVKVTPTDMSTGSNTGSSNTQAVPDGDQQGKAPSNARIKITGVAKPGQTNGKPRGYKKPQSGTRAYKLMQMIWAGFQKHNISDINEIAAFLASVEMETGALSQLIEKPSKWPSSRSKWKGRGIIQLTGNIYKNKPHEPGNYAGFAKYLNRPDILTNPDIVGTDDFLCVEAGFYWWIKAAAYRNVQGLARAGRFRDVRSVMGTGGLYTPAKENNEALDLSTYIATVNVYLQGKGPLWYDGPIDANYTSAQPGQYSDSASTDTGGSGSAGTDMSTGSSSGGSGSGGGIMMPEPSRHGFGKAKIVAVLGAGAGTYTPTVAGIGGGTTSSGGSSTGGSTSTGNRFGGPGEFRDSPNNDGSGLSVRFRLPNGKPMSTAGTSGAVGAIGSGYARSAHQDKVVVTAPSGPAESASKVLSRSNFEVKTNIAEINKRIKPCSDSLKNSYIKAGGKKHIVDNLVCITDKSGKLQATVHKYYAPYFQGFIIELENAGYKISTLSGFRAFSKTGRLSRHRFGAAFDIDGFANKYTYPRHSPRVQKNWKQIFSKYLGPNFEAIVDGIRKKWGVWWGADYQDLMHFEAGRGDIFTESVLLGKHPMPRIPIPLPGSIGSGKDISKDINPNTKKAEELEAKEDDGPQGAVPEGGGEVAEQGATTGTTVGSSGASTSGSSSDTTLGKEYGSLTPGGGIGGALGNIGGSSTSERPSPVAEAYGLQKTGIRAPEVQPGVLAADKAMGASASNMERIATEQLVVLKQILTAVQGLGGNGIIPANNQAFTQMIGGIANTASAANVGMIQTALKDAMGNVSKQMGTINTQIGNMSKALGSSTSNFEKYFKDVTNKNPRSNTGLPINPVNTQYA